MKLKSKLIAMMMSVVVLLSACTVAKTETNLMVKIAHATEIITQEEDISSLEGGTLSVSAAKGETEGAQIIVRPDGDIPKYDISVSDLKCGNNTIDKSAVSVQVEIYSYATAKQYSDTLPDGYYPDALIPVENIVEAEENTIKANKNQGFFVDFSIPEDAVAGVYTGEIVINCQGKKMTVPVELEVYDFTISQVPYTKTCYLIWQDWLTYGEFDSSDDKYMDYYDKMLEYNVCAYTFPHKTADEFVSYVREYYDKVACFGIPYNALTTTTNDWEKTTAYITELANAAVEDGKNYFDKAYYYWDMYYDEYNSIDWREAAMRAILEGCDDSEETLVANLINEGKIANKDAELAQSIINLSHVIPGGAYDEKLAEYDVTHCPASSAVGTTARMETFIQQTPESEDLWWYHAIHDLDFPSSDKSINGYRIAGRDHFWSNYELGIVGDLFWNATGFCNWWAYDSAGAYAPLDDLYSTASHDNISNGDGYLMYPGLAYNSDEPFGSLRMVSIRDGIDDNTYMGMLGDKYKEMSSAYNADVTDAKSFVSFLNTNVISRQVSKLDSKMLEDARKALAQAVQLANKCGLVIEELAVEQNVISYTLYTDSETELSINGAKPTATNAGTGKCYKGTVDLLKSNDLTFEFTKAGKSNVMKLWTVSTGQLVSSYEQDADLSKCIVYSNYNSSVSLNKDSKYTKNGNSAKVILSGYNFNNAENNEQFMPKLGFLLSDVNKKMSEVNAIEFWVYNAQSTDLQVTVYLEGTSSSTGKVSFDYDTLILDANSWTKVTIDSFCFVNTDNEKLDVYTEYGIRIPNQIGKSYQLYVDDLFVR